MHLSRLELWNFRKYGTGETLDLKTPHLSVSFHEGVSVLVGENDSGKSAIIDAIRLVLGTSNDDADRLADTDFTRNSERMRIGITIEGLTPGEAKHFIEYLTWDKSKPDEYKLKLAYEARRVKGRIMPPELRAGADLSFSWEARELLRCTYLRPLRDADRELVPRRNSRISRIFQQHQAFSGRDKDHYLLGKFEELNSSIENYFRGQDQDGNLLPDTNGLALKEEIDRYLSAFCAGETLSTVGVTEGTLRSILERLYLGFDDIINPGLGSLNRLFMAAELLHLNKSDWQGLRLGLIEELEAHLHPQAQLKVVKQLRDQKNVQMILTTHSPNLASTVPLRNLLLCRGQDVFSLDPQSTLLAEADYQFLEAFLDVTKANLFFAKGVILAEGWAEEILLPALARKMKAAGIIHGDLTDAGVSVVNIGGLAFGRYAKIFQRKSEPYLDLPVAVVTDNDCPEFELNNGKPERRDPTQLATDKLLAEEKINQRIEGQGVKVFVAPHWTLEFSLIASPTIRPLFLRAMQKHHHDITETNLEEKVAERLLKSRLKKREIAYDLAAALDADNTPTLQDHDQGVGYLIRAIKYAIQH